MKATLRAVAVLIAALALSGGAAAAKPSPPPPATAVTTQADTDVGNDRPQVSYDGLMVRRRVVLAIHSTANADLASLRAHLDLAATHRHTTLSTMSASTLDPAVLERLAPDLVVALPSGASRADAGRVMDSAFAEGGGMVNNVKEVDVLPVLVHDLRFTVATARPEALAKAIAREGIVTDALGNYTTTLGAHQLRISYTGRLLSDHLVQSVRIGIARPAHSAPVAVTVSPRSTTGAGVNMAKEPPPAPAIIHASIGHHHDATPAGTSTSSHVDPWPFPAFGLLAALGLALALLMTNRNHRSDTG
jgi:hypothetical protein